MFGKQAKLELVGGIAIATSFAVSAAPPAALCIGAALLMLLFGGPRRPAV